MAGTVDTIHAGQLANLLFETLGYGTHGSPHDQLKGHHLWPTKAIRMQPKHHAVLLKMFEKPCKFDDGTVQYKDTRRRSTAKYIWIIKENIIKEKTDE